MGRNRSIKEVLILGMVRWLLRPDDLSSVMEPGVEGENLFLKVALCLLHAHPGMCGPNLYTHVKMYFSFKPLF